MLGSQGRGVLSISGGLAVYPFDANTAEQLYEAADKALMFGAKKSGKNSIFLVGNPQPQQPSESK
jgi:predicted signal transduction protein with EAL and GGDEF domain